MFQTLFFNNKSDSPRCRDIILHEGTLKPIINILQNASDLQTIKVCTWTLSNLCRQEPLPQYQLVQDAVLPLCQVLINETDSEVLQDSAWAISNLSENNDDGIERICNSGVIPTLLKLIHHENKSIILPCLNTLGTICSGSDQQVDQVLNSNALPEIFRLLQDKEKYGRRNSCWILSNIAAGADYQKAEIINQKQYLQILFECMMSDTSELTRQATWVISNCTSSNNPENTQNILKLIENNVLQIHYDILKKTKDTITINLILKSIKNILYHGQTYFMQGSENPFCIQVQALGIQDLILDFQKHPDEDVYLRSLEIIEEFFQSGDKMR